MALTVARLSQRRERARSHPGARFWLAISSFLLVAIAFLPCATAQGRVAYLAERLKYPPPAGIPDDFRVRTNAALALGATADEGAVPPLCGGLSDPSEVVRQAAALAFRKLGRPTALPCLRAREEVEPSASVKLQVKRAIEALAAGAAPPPPPPDPPPSAGGAKFYVSLGDVTNNTSRATPEVGAVVLDAFRRKLRAAGAFQLAPSGESPEAARAAMAKGQLRGLYLIVRVEKLLQSDGALKASIGVVVNTYPGKAMRGNFSREASLPGAQKGDTGAEDRLLSALAEGVAEKFVQLAEQYAKK